MPICGSSPTTIFERGTLITAHGQYTYKEGRRTETRHVRLERQSPGHIGASLWTDGKGMPLLRGAVIPGGGGPSVKGYVPS